MRLVFEYPDGRTLSVPHPWPDAMRKGEGGRWYLAGLPPGGLVTPRSGGRVYRVVRNEVSDDRPCEVRTVLAYS